MPSTPNDAMGVSSSSICRIAWLRPGQVLARCPNAGAVPNARFAPLAVRPRTDAMNLDVAYIYFAARTTVFSHRTRVGPT